MIKFGLFKFVSYLFKKIGLSNIKKVKNKKNFVYSIY